MVFRFGPPQLWDQIRSLQLGQIRIRFVLELISICSHFYDMIPLILGSISMPFLCPNINNERYQL